MSIQRIPPSPQPNPHRRFWRPDQPGPRLRHLDTKDQVQADDGFACIQPGKVLPVRRDSSPNRRRFVTCDHGRHYLHADPDERVAGFQLLTIKTAVRQ